MSERDAHRIGAETRVTKHLSEADVALFALVMGEAPLTLDEPPTIAPQVRQIAPMALLAALLTTATARHSTRPGAARVLGESVRFHEPAYTDDSVTATAQVTEHDTASHVLRVRATCVNQEGRRLADGDFLLADD